MNNELKMNNEILNNYKIAGKIHHKVKKYAKENIKPNMKLTSIVKLIEDKIKEYYLDYESLLGISTNQLNNCIAFPTGICVNNIVAHHTFFMIKLF